MTLLTLRRKLLKNVKPSSCNNLFSYCSKLAEKGVSVEFKGKTCRITVNDKKYLIGHKHGELYKLNTLTENEACYVGQTSL